MTKMDSQDEMTEAEIDRNLEESYPASDPPSWTLGTDHKPARSRKTTPGDSVRLVFHKLARLFNGLHWMIGITTLPPTATPREERSFVLMWIGIVVFIIGFFAIFFYLL